MESLLEQRLREGRLSGILNGVDPGIWDPAHDLLLSARYNRDTLEAKAENKRQLQIAMGLKVDDSVPVFRIVGGADVIMVPSRFEPCGLTQLYGLKYGTLPLVRRTGGLADTVNDSSLENLADGIASGFSFEDSNAWSLLRAIRRAFVLWSRPSLWRYVQRQAMGMDFSWQVAAQAYRDLYQRLL